MRRSIPILPARLSRRLGSARENWLRDRADLRAFNPHVIVTRATRTGDSPAHQTCFTRVLRPAGTMPSRVGKPGSPALAATAVGMQDSGLVRYLAGNVDSDGLGRTAPAGQRTRALLVLPRAP